MKKAPPELTPEQLVKFQRGSLIAIVALALAIHGFLEIRAQLAVRSMRATRMGIVTAAPDLVDPRNVGKDIYLVGDITSATQVGDPPYFPAGSYLAVKRSVRMFREQGIGRSCGDRWVHEEADTRRSGCGRYQPKPYLTSGLILAPGARFGAYDASQVLAHLARTYPAVAPVPLNGFVVRGDELFRPVDPRDPDLGKDRKSKIGDLFMSYSVALPGLYSVVARQGANGVLEPIAVAAREPKVFAALGKVERDDLIGVHINQESGSTTDTVAALTLAAWVLLFIRALLKTSRYGAGFLIAGLQAAALCGALLVLSALYAATAA